ncbi:MAG: erythromycin esterase family protein [Niastella sp.]|nr:erythromycin esterase family protein [Niastella sp.]
MKQRSIILLSSFLLLLYVDGYTQVSFNGGFEYIGYDDKPEKWFMPSPAPYEVFTDSVNPYSGRYSARIIHTPKAVNASGCVYYQEIDLSSFSDYRKITVRYHFRINKGWNTYLKYFIQPVNPARIKVIDTSFFRINGSYSHGAWYEYEATAWVTPGSIQEKAVRIGLIAQALIDINVDDISILIDDKPLLDLPIQHPPRQLPDSKDMEWLNHSIVSLQATADLSAMKDLSFLKKAVGNAQVVALGESTHGTREFNVLRSRIIHYLVDNMGFEVIAFENGITEMNIANTLLQDGNYSSAQIVDSLFTRVHQTTEVTALVDVLRKKRNVVLAGFDDQKIYYPLLLLKQKLQPLSTMLYDSTVALDQYVSRFRSSTGRLDSMYHHACRLLQHFLAAKPGLAAATGPTEMAWLEKNFRSLVNSIYLSYLYAQASASQGTPQYVSANYRDSLMAANVVWLRDFYKNKKIILWCHNTHIQKKSNGYYDGKHVYQGEYLLKTSLGPLYKSFAFLTATGEAISFRLNNRGGDTAVLQLPYRICYEYYLGQARYPVFFWQLPAGRQTRVHTALTRGLEWRSLGSQIIPGADQFHPADMLNNFDGVFFIRSTTPAGYFYLK